MPIIIYKFEVPFLEYKPGISQINFPNIYRFDIIARNQSKCKKAIFSEREDRTKRRNSKDVKEGGKR